MPVLNPPNDMPHSYQPPFDFDGKLKAQYEKAYQTGLTWNVNWYPGGPDRRGNDDMYCAYHSGFLDGINAKIAADPAFGDWFNKNRGVVPHMSYKS